MKRIIRITLTLFLVSVFLFQSQTILPATGTQAYQNIFKESNHRPMFMTLEDPEMLFC